MAKLSYAEEEIVFHHNFVPALVAAGILDEGRPPSDKPILSPNAAECPHCGFVVELESTIADQVVVCDRVKQAGGRVVRKGCGQSFDVKARPPMVNADWCGAPPTRDKRVSPAWRKGVPLDHPARTRFAELLGKFLAQVEG